MQRPILSSTDNGTTKKSSVVQNQVGIKAMKTVAVMFKDTKYNYTTSVNAKVSFDEIVSYFVGQWFNVGTGEEDNMQQCTAVMVE